VQSKNTILYYYTGPKLNQVRMARCEHINSVIYKGSRITDPLPESADNYHIYLGLQTGMTEPQSHHRAAHPLGTNSREGVQEATTLTPNNQ
ncbi:10957_t:CDS:2, partial [Dentiscutata erythropus]